MKIYTFLVVKYKLVNPFSCLHIDFIVQWGTVVAHETGQGGAVWPANYRSTVALTKHIFYLFPASLGNKFVKFPHHVVA